MKLRPALPDKVLNLLNQLEKDLVKNDPFGLKLNRVRAYAPYIYKIYHDYFKVRTFGAHRIPNSKLIVVANHSGQLAFDALLISSSFLLNAPTPQILRAMVERFFVNIPFINRFATECGAVLGDRKNCLKLLDSGHSVLVFPEGVKGIAKDTKDYYQLKAFTRGFMRIAIETQTPILPLAVVGAEEFYPLVYHPQKMKKTLGLPAFPLGPHLFIGGLPLPSPVDIYIGNPYQAASHLSPKASDNAIDLEVVRIKNQIDEMISLGLRRRRPFWANKDRLLPILTRRERS